MRADFPSQIGIGLFSFAACAFRRSFQIAAPFNRLVILLMVVAFGETGASRLTDDFARLSAWVFLTIIDITGATANDANYKNTSFGHV
jgi:hypothetical protein